MKARQAGRGEGKARQTLAVLVEGRADTVARGALPAGGEDFEGDVVERENHPDGAVGCGPPGGRKAEERAIAFGGRLEVVDNQDDVVEAGDHVANSAENNPGEDAR